MLLRWRHRDVDEQTDRELATLFSEAAERLEPDALALQRAQARVAAMLNATTAETGGGLRRRLAFGAVGGGALWAAAVGSAAAHKAVAVAVVGSLIVGGGVVAEQTGVGETVRESIGLDRAFEALTSQDSEGDATGQGSGAPSSASPTATGTAPAGATVATEAAPDGLPGQLHSMVRDDGSFQLRAVLQGYGPDSVELYIASDEGGSVVTLTLDAAATVSVPGKPGDATGTDQLDGYVGRLVMVQGACTAADDAVVSGGDCLVSGVQVLGGPADAGPGAGPSSSGTESGPGNGQGQGNGQGNGNGLGPGNVPGPNGSQSQGNRQGQGSSSEGDTDVVPDQTADADEAATPGPPEHSSAGGQGKGDGKPE